MNRFDLLDHVPIGLLALQEDYTVVFWNSCLEEWTGIPKEKILGVDIRTIFPDLSKPIYVTRLQGVFAGGPPVVFSSQLHKHIIPVQTRNGQFQIQHTIVTNVPATERSGFYALFVIQDVTDLTQRIQEYRAMHDRAVQEALARQRAQEIAEALRDTSAVLNTTLQLEEVLDRILANIGRIVAYGTVDIMLVENGMARVVRSQGKEGISNAETVLNVELSIADTPILRTMTETGQPSIIPDTRTDPDWIEMPNTLWIRSYAGAPIFVRGQLAGFLGLASAEPNFFSPDKIEILKAFANQAAIAIQNARLYAQVEHLAVTDELTGLNNRRGFFEQSEREFDRARRYAHPLAVVMFDIDHFKQINDRYGHAFGDRVLRALGEVCRQHTRAIDIAGRYGGEEFIILLPETNLSDAEFAAERLRQAIAEIRVPFENNTEIGITVSLGVANITPEITQLAELVECADQAQYIAKQTGRDRVVVYTKQ